MGTPVNPFAGLPAPVFFDSDPTVLAQAFIIGYEAGYQAFSGVPLTLGQADPRYYEQLYNAFLISQTYANGNLVAYQNLLQFATGSNLDQLGSFWGELGLRLQSQGAQTEITFSVQFPPTAPISIPIGTSVSTSSNGVTVSFVTTQVAVINAGFTSGSALAQCTQIGSIGNGFIPGQISQINNFNSPYVVTASNTTISGGGADTETDAAFRIRLWMAPKALSTCGTQAGYEFFALSANASITSVSAWSNPGISGTVMIAALTTGGVPASPSVQAQILAACSPVNNRPLSDLVLVTNPSGAPFEIQLSYYIPQSLSSNIAQINSSVDQAVETFQTNTEAVLGEFIDPTPLETAIAGLGCIGINIESPTFYACQPWEQPVLVDDPVIIYNGLI